MPAPQPTPQPAAAAPLQLTLLRPPLEARLAPGQPDEALAALVATRVAHAEAYGRLCGREHTLGELAEAVARLERGLNEDAQQCVDQMARYCSELALGIVRELLGQELLAGRYDIEALVRGALAASLAERRPVRVHLAPQDAEILREVPFSADTKLVPDAALSPGDLYVDGPHGRLVRALDERLQAISTALRARYPG